MAIVLRNAYANVYSRGMNRIAAAVIAAAAVVTISATGAQGQGLESKAPRWEKPALTVHIADTKAWAKTDVVASVASWSSVIPLTLTDDPHADITLTAGATQDEAPTAYPAFEGNEITSCRIVLPTRLAGRDSTFVLPHELGHCLGLDHDLFTRGPSVMFWVAGAPQFSAMPTSEDLAGLRNLYR